MLLAAWLLLRHAYYLFSSTPSQFPDISTPMADYDASWWSKIQTVLLFPLKRQAIEACAT